ESTPTEPPPPSVLQVRQVPGCAPLHPGYETSPSRSSVAVRNFARLPPSPRCERGWHAQRSLVPGVGGRREQLRLTRSKRPSAGTCCSEPCNFSRARTQGRETPRSPELRAARDRQFPNR